MVGACVSAAACVPPANPSHKLPLNARDPPLPPAPCSRRRSTVAHPAEDACLLAAALLSLRLAHFLLSIFWRLFYPRVDAVKVLPSLRFVVQRGLDFRVLLAAKHNALNLSGKPHGNHTHAQPAQHRGRSKRTCSCVCRCARCPLQSVDPWRRVSSTS